MKEFITEKDLFDFVFFPNLLTQEKYFFLHSSKDFEEEVLFFTDLKNFIQSEPTDEDKALIARKIPVYKAAIIIQLYPVNQEKKRKLNSMILTAASENQNEPAVNSKTFYNKDKTYIIKIINYEKSSKIFVFSPQYYVVNDFDIIFKPQNIKFHIKDNTLPLELQHCIEPESVVLEFKLQKQF